MAKILYTAKEYFPKIGGLETVAIQLAEHFVKRGHDVKILCCGKNDEVTNINGVEVIRVKPFLNVGSAPVSFKYIKKFRELAREADILHFHVPNPIGELAFCLDKDLKAKTICTYHLDPVRPKAFVKVYKKLLHKFLNRMQIICPTSENYINSSDVLGEFKNKCCAIPLGVDIKTFADVEPENILKAEELVKNFSRPRILFCGRFSYYKGIKYLVEAMMKIPDANLILVGDGEEYERVQNQVHELNLTERICFVGRLTFDIYRAMYHVCDLFVLPSVFRSEAFGLVGIEAMSAGLPIITTELGGGTSYYNIDGETGFVISPANVDELTNAVKKILADKNLAEQFSKNAIEQVKEFSLEKMYERYEKVYESLI